MQDAYTAARAAADAAYTQIWEPAAARYAKAETEAVAIGERVPRSELDARMRAAAKAVDAWRAIMGGPAQDVDEALAAVGRCADVHD